MASVTPLLVVPIILALIHGGAPTPAPPEDCGAGKTVVEEGQTRVVAEEQEENSYISLTRYVNPEPGFQGLSVSVDGNNDTRFSAWFNATADCFPSNDKWLQLLVLASIRSDENVEMGFKINECWKQCKKNITVEKLLQLNVSAHGPSEWLTDEPPSHCDVTKVNPSLPKPSSKPICSDPPTPPPHTTEVSTTLWWPWLLVVVLVALAIVAAVSYKFYQKKQQQNIETSRDAGSSLDQLNDPMSCTPLRKSYRSLDDTSADNSSGQEDPPTGDSANRSQPIEPTSDRSP